MLEQPNQFRELDFGAAIDLLQTEAHGNASQRSAAAS
jgi:hypothetical protein